MADVFVAMLEDRKIGFAFEVFEKEHDAMVQIGKWQKAEEIKSIESPFYSGKNWEVEKTPDAASGILYLVSSECDDGPTMYLWRKEVKQWHTLTQSSKK